MPDIAQSATNTPRRIRQRNELAVLRTLHQHKRLSRADLARELRMNRSSSGNIVMELLSEGLIREGEVEGLRPAGRAGRPGILLELVPDAVCFVGVEIGVEHLTAVEIDLDARVKRWVQEPFDSKAAGVDLSLARALHLAFDTMGHDRLARCEGLGIATPAQMDGAGKIRVAPILGWADIDLAGLARQALPPAVPVMAENDANAFAIGATYGRKVSHRGVTLLVNLESGVGGGILINGNLFRGGTGLAGEIGHLRMACDSAATVEDQVGLSWLMTQYQARTGRAQVSLPDLLQDVRDREPGAVSIAEDWARALAFALSQVGRIIDADTIVLGGSVAALYPLVVARVLTHLRGFQADTFPLPQITVAEGPESGAAFGAACMMHQRFLSLDSMRLSESAALLA